MKGRPIPSLNLAQGEYFSRRGFHFNVWTNDKASTWIRTRTYATHPHFWLWNPDSDAMVSSILSESHKLIGEIGDPHVPLRVSQKSQQSQKISWMIIMPHFLPIELPRHIMDSIFTSGPTTRTQCKASSLRLQPRIYSWNGWCFNNTQIYIRATLMGLN